MKLLYVNLDEQFTESVVSFVAKVTEMTNSEITIFYAAKDEADLMVGQKTLDLEREILADLKVETRLQIGEPVELLIAELERAEYDMLILKIRRRRNLIPSPRRLLFQKVLNLSPVPVMLVRHANIRLERMLVCTSGQQISDPVVKLSAQFAKIANLSATVLHVRGSVPSMYTGMSEMDEHLEEVLSTETPLAQHLRDSAECLAENNVDAQLEVRYGVVAQLILEKAEKGTFDLIVLGASGKKPITQLLMNDVTQQIINRASSAVLVVK